MLIVDGVRDANVRNNSQREKRTNEWLTSALEVRISDERMLFLRHQSEKEMNVPFVQSSHEYSALHL